MTTSDTTPRATKWQPLDPNQRRVLGVLIEKAKTTPAAYPMTVNAIVTGCNQKNNRDPVTTLDDVDVERALDQLRTLGAVSEVDWVGRVSKWKHHAYEWLGVDKPEIAVMTELLLRGAQPLGDLRARAARMEPIADLAALKPIVESLLAKTLMIELTPAGRGQVVSHNLYLPAERSELEGRPGGASPAAAAPRERTGAPPAPRVNGGSGAGELAAIRDQLATQMDQLAAQMEQLAALDERVRRLEERLGEGNE